nr:hypothetical protein [uncultured Draconibacterium sp.]
MANLIGVLQDKIINTSMVFSILFVFNISIIQSASGQGVTFVDKEGCWRWSADSSEVNLFGVNYTTPFAHSYRAHNYVNVDHGKAIDQDIYNLTRLGLKAYRVHVWDTEISDTLGNLIMNEHLRLLDYTIKSMKDRGFKIVLTPLAYWGNGYPEWDKKTPGFSRKYGKDGCLTIPDAITAQENYLKQFIMHTNPYTNLAYNEDPDIIAIEINNEPHHSGTPDQTTNFINRMVKSLKDGGCKVPVFYCMAFSPQLLDAYLDADIEGGTVQWYSTGLVSNRAIKGNLLPKVANWPKYHITSKIQQSKKALLSYEFDAADNTYSFLYPSMARCFREAGFQFAAQFCYDPMNIAYANTEYQTHFMNLAYAPQKALGLKIAARVFEWLPRNSPKIAYPESNSFGPFHLSYNENLAEMVTDEVFIYTNTTNSAPENLSDLKEIAGYGRSKIVNYPGFGAYFLDKLEDGVWRLEVMPDAIGVNDPFERASLSKEVSVCIWKDYKMKIRIPDLGNNFSIKQLNAGNSYSAQADNGAFKVSPGAYLLQREGVSSEWNSESEWKNIKLGEYIAPDNKCSKVYVLHDATEEIAVGSNLEINAKVVTPEKLEKVELFKVGDGIRRTSFSMTQMDSYTWNVKLPEEMFSDEGILNYVICVHLKDETRTFPTDVKGKPVDWDYYDNKSWETRIVKPATPLCIFDASKDGNKINRPTRYSRFTFYPSEIPGKKMIVLDSRILNPVAFYFREKIRGRISELGHKKKLVLTGKSLNNQEVPVEISLGTTEGFYYTTTINFMPQKKDYEIELSKFRFKENQSQTSVPDNEVTPGSIVTGNDILNINNIEIVQCALPVSKDSERQDNVAIERITLKE